MPCLSGAGVWVEGRFRWVVVRACVALSAGLVQRSWPQSMFGGRGLVRDRGALNPPALLPKAAAEDVYSFQLRTYCIT
ncbi:hypothetical protein QQF64_026377 [Cirrhinus molitorella]|uniref:Secreted protein n=1 Tax=Cirrhinus molitorella TaxID=172907 RepID=A0ABR3N9V5_9TELE